MARQAFWIGAKWALSISAIAGVVSCAGVDYTLDHGDVLYLPKGAGAVTFSGQGRFYITSAPAHKELEAKLIKIEDAKSVHMGAPETSNERTIYQFIHPLVMESCQLILGYTKLHQGSVLEHHACPCA